MQWLSQGVLLLMVTPWQLDPCLGSHGGKPFVQIKMLHKSQEAWSLGQHAGVRWGFQSEAHTSQNQPCCHGTLARSRTFYLLLLHCPLEAYPRPRWLQPPNTFYSCWGLKERFSSLHPCSVGGSLTPKKMSNFHTITNYVYQRRIGRVNLSKQRCSIKTPLGWWVLIESTEGLVKTQILGLHSQSSCFRRSIWGLENCITNRFPSDAEAAGLGPLSEKPSFRTFIVNN